jgi:hypothetical protein
MECYMYCYRIDYSTTTASAYVIATDFAEAIEIAENQLVNYPIESIHLMGKALVKERN